MGEGGVVVEPVRAADRAALEALSTAEGQADWVATNAESLAEAEHDPDARPRAIRAGDRLVGFLMYEAPAASDTAKIYRFMIDRAAQGQGFGRRALVAILAEISGLAHVRRVEICYMPDNEAARRLYGSAGFVETGLDEDGEQIAVLELVRTGSDRRETR